MRRPLLFVLMALLAAWPRSGRAASGEARTHAKAHYQRAVTEYNLGHFQRAIEELQSAYELDPAAILLFNLAQAHRQLGERDKAAFFFRRYLEMDPKGQSAEVARARLRQLQKEAAAPPPATAPQGREPPPPLDPPPASPAPAPPEPSIASRPTPPPVIILAPTAPPPPALPTPARTVEVLIGLGTAHPAFSGRDLPALWLPAVHGEARYRLPLSRLDLAFGGGLDYARLPYERSSGGQTQGSHLLGALALAALDLPLPHRLEAEVQVGGGVVWWMGLGDGNGITFDGAGASGPVPMPAARIAATLRWHPLPVAFLALSPGWLVCKPTSGLADSLARLSLAFMLVEAGLSL